MLAYMGKKAVYKRSAKRRQNNCLTCIYPAQCERTFEGVHIYMGEEVEGTAFLIYANFYRFFLAVLENFYYLCTRNSFNIINSY